MCGAGGYPEELSAFASFLATLVTSAWKGVAWLQRRLRLSTTADHFLWVELFLIRLTHKAQKRQKIQDHSHGHR